MDFRVNSRGYCLFLCLIAVVISLSYGKDCRECKPGYYASRTCTKSHDTVCKPCSKGTFTSVSNNFQTCSMCSRCDLGEFVAKECSKNSDTVCKLCSEVKDTHSVLGNYVVECLNTQSDQASTDPELTQTDELTQTNDNIYESSSDPGDLNVYVVYGEGSGESVTDEPDQNETIITSVGNVPIIVEEPIENITVEVLPEVTTKKIMIVDGGIVLDNDTNTKDIKDVLLQSTKHTTLSTIILDDDKGIHINPEPENVDDVTDDVVVGHTSRTGASKGEDHKSGGTSIGVVVTVGLVAALVFFILGFVASKYWSSRRERTFNVLEAERFNGKAPVECSAIEYKDGEKPANKASIYDEIPAGKKLNGSTNDTRDPEKAASDPVYSKPIKRETAPKTSAQPPVAPNRGDPSPRPTSEIRFIDEEQDETDRLLSSGTGSDVTNDSKESSSTASGSSENKIGNGSADEKTPMLSSGNDAQNS